MYNDQTQAKTIVVTTTQFTIGTGADRWRMVPNGDTSPELQCKNRNI